MSDLRLYLLGTPRVEYHNLAIRIERRKALALAAYLALSDRPVSREAMATLLWPELDDVHSRSALRSTLRTLTANSTSDWITADRATLALQREAVWVDALEFTDEVAAASSHGHDDDDVCELCEPLLKRAIELYRADFLAGFHLHDCAEFEEWHHIQTEWLRREYADCLRRLSGYYADHERLDQAIRLAHLWLASDPLHEPAHRQLMRLYALTGQRSEALRQYQQCAELLDRELATPPERETSELYKVIQTDQLSPGLPDAGGAALPNSVMPPLPPLVIGREAALREIKQRLGIGGGAPRPVTVVQGWPGVGKSTTTAQIAHDRDIAHAFPDGVLWASLGENPDLFGALEAWAAAHRLNEPARARKLEEISALLTAALRDKRVLLIVDDVWRAEHAAPFRVGGQHAALLFTSRLNDVSADLAPTAADIYRLPLLSETAGLELMRSLAPDTLDAYPNETRQLVVDLEGLPLALHVAGRLLHMESRLGWGVRELLADLRQGAGLLQAQVPAQMIGGGQDTSPTIAALLKRSTDLLDADMRLRFAYLSLFAPKPATFDLEAMQIAWNIADARPTARVLVSRGLLEPAGGGRFQMHALLVMHSRSILEAEGLES